MRARSSILASVALASTIHAGEIKWISPVPADDQATKHEMEFPQDCPGSQCNGPCTWLAATVAVEVKVKAQEGYRITKVTWKVLDGDGDEIAGLGGTGFPGVASWQKLISGTLGANLSIGCETSTSRTLKVSAVETEVVAPPAPPATNEFSKELKLTFICQKCVVGQSGAGGANSGTTVPPRSVPQSAKLQFWIMNFLDVPQPFDVTFLASSGWPVNALLPSIVVLEPGESLSFWATVSVPPGIPAGHVEAVSMIAIPLEGGPPIVVENALEVLPLTTTLCPGDVNGDGEVDSVDLGRVLGAYSSWTITGDLNGDHFVDSQDLALVLGNWGRCGHTCEGAMGDCFVAHANGGCVDAACCESVCGNDPYCCAQLWDELCVGLAGMSCGSNRGGS